MLRKCQESKSSEFCFVVQTHQVKSPSPSATPANVPPSEPSQSEPAAAAAAAAAASQVTEPAAASTSVSGDEGDGVESQAKIPKLDHDSKVEK